MRAKRGDTLPVAQAKRHLRHSVQGMQVGRIDRERLLIMRQRLIQPFQVAQDIGLDVERFGSEGPVFERAAARDKRFLQPAQVPQDNGDIGQRIDMARRKRCRAGEAGQRLVQPLQIAKGRAAVVPAAGIVGTQGQGTVIPLQRLFCSFQFQ